jgi:multicomponent Na+:H+ antiporter subunit E
LSKTGAAGSEAIKKADDHEGRRSWRQAIMMMALKRFALFAAVFSVFSGGRPDPFTLADILVGALAAAAATALSLRLLPGSIARHTGVLAALKIAPRFLWGSFIGGLDVARRAFDPWASLNPGWLRHETRLEPGPALVSFGAEISLMPGTLAAGVEGRTLLVHCLDLDAGAAGALAREEAHLARSIGSQGQRAGERDHE